MVTKQRNGQYWAVEFAGERVRVCRFSLRGERVEVERCETRPAEGFDFAAFRHEIPVRDPGEGAILCAVPRSEVLLKPIVLPHGGAVDLRKVTALKLEQTVSDLNPATTRWGYMAARPEGESGPTHVLAAAISRPYVEELIGRHFGDGVRPVLVECAALAAVRAHLALEGESRGCELIVDCAPDALSIFVVRNGVVESAHLVPGNRAIEVALGEIRRLILFLRSQRDPAPVEAITCLGGDVAERLATALREQVGTTVADQLAQRPPWVEDAALPGDWDRAWHRIVGLIEAVRNEEAQAINFVGEERPRRAARAMVPALERVRTPLLAAAFAGLLAVAVFGQRTLAKWQERSETQIINRAGAVTQDLERWEQARTILQRYRSERFSLSQIFFELATEVAPRGVTLTSLTLNPDGQVDITGQCKRFAEADEFARQLNESDYFTAAQTHSRRRERDRVIFKIAFKLAPAAKRTTP